MIYSQLSALIICQISRRKYGTLVDRNAWNLSADTVNAMYSPLTNTIMFPAAILQALYYDLEQTASQNYGGIGVVAHEITHAFDNNGALFDELPKLWSRCLTVLNMPAAR